MDLGLFSKLWRVWTKAVLNTNILRKRKCKASSGRQSGLTAKVKKCHPKETAYLGVRVSNVFCFVLSVFF